MYIVYCIFVVEFVECFLKKVILNWNIKLYNIVCLFIFKVKWYNFKIKVFEMKL